MTDCICEYIRDSRAHRDLVYALFLEMRGCVYTYFSIQVIGWLLVRL